MEILSKFDYEKVQFDKENLVTMMLNLKAPTVELETERQPLNLVAVLDISASMTCDNKIESMKRTAQVLVEHLSEKDKLGIVIFSSQVSKLASLKPCTSERKEELKRRIEKLTTQDCTNISGATLLGYELMKTTEGHINRVLLLTDGLPNIGVSGLAGLTELVKNRPKEITLSTFGFGTDHDPELLQAMAKAGDGNFYFIENPDAINTAFAQELGGLLTCYAQNISLKITPKSGVKIDEVLNDAYEYDIKEKETEIRIPDMFSEETRNALLKLKLEPRTSVLPRKTCITKVIASFTNLNTKKTETMEISTKIAFVKPGEESTEKNKEVKEAEAILEVGKAQAEAVKMANSGNFSSAQALMLNCCEAVKAVGTSRADELGEELESWANNLTSSSYNAQVGYSGTRSAYSATTGRTGGQSSGLFVGTSHQRKMVRSFDEKIKPNFSIPLTTKKKKSKKKSNKPFSGEFLEK